VRIFTLVLVFAAVLAFSTVNAFAIALVYDGGGPQSTIQAAMAELGMPFDLRTPGNPVTLGDLASHEILIVGWNLSGDMSGVPAAVLEAGITGNVVITGHDADVHLVHGADMGPGGGPVDVAATLFVTQAIAFATSGAGTGLVAFSDLSTAFAYLPASWGVTAVGGLLEETITAFTADGLASGIYAGLTPADMSNWLQSFHTRFASTGMFYAYELGGAGGDYIVTIGGQVMRAFVDIKPGSCPNPLNTKSNGVLPVAVLGSEYLDVADIDPETIELEGVSPLRWSYEDVATPVIDGEPCECNTLGPDGYMDLVLHFDTQEVVAALGLVTDGDYVELTLTLETFSGIVLDATDCVWIKDKGKDHSPPPRLYTGVFTAEGSAVLLSLPDLTDVSAVVYDIRGRQVATLVNGSLPAGEHTIRWNGIDGQGSAVADGIYFCHIKAGAVEQTAKMILVK